MAEKSLREKTVNGVLWSGVDRFSSQGIQFIFNILIARILMPEDYGAVAMLGIFLAISQTFIDSGFANALIRKNDRTEDDYNTVFYFNLTVSILFYVVLWIAAPAIASFYKLPILTSISRVVSITLVINALGAIQNTKLSIDLDFRKKAVVSIASVLIIGVIGLWMALKGYGVWALVAQSVAGSSIRTILQWFMVRWMPSIRFSWTSFKEMFSFGSKLLASSLIDTIYNNAYTIVIGRLFSSASLGLYNKAESFAQFPSGSMTGMLQSVSYPVLSSIQNDEDRLKESYIKFINLSAFIMFPLMVGLAAVSDPFVRIVLTDKWEGSIPFLKILCLALMWYPIHAINLNILQVKGRSDYFLRLEIIKKILGIVVLCITIPLGLMPMCIGRVFTSIVCLPINTYYAKRLIGYGFSDQMSNMFHIIILSFTMGAIVFAIVKVFPTPWLQLTIGTIVGATFYMFGASFLNFPEFNDLRNILKDKFKNK